MEHPNISAFSKLYKTYGWGGWVKAVYGFLACVKSADHADSVGFKIFKIGQKLTKLHTFI